MKRIAALAVASEIYPLIKTGGLADVTGALPLALRDEGIDVHTLVPGYPDVMNAVASAKEVLQRRNFSGGEARILAARAAGLDLLILDAPHLFQRAGNPYTTAEGADWPDNGIRFAALARMAGEIGQGAIPGFAPRVLHAHDWQAALAPAFMQYNGKPRPGTVVTVHNLAFQGQFAPDILEEIGLPPESFAIDGVEYYGAIGFLKAGLQLADRITTVSPTYASEIRSPEFGMGLDGLLRMRAGILSGILNGIDTTVWNPAADPNIPAAFDHKNLSDRCINKMELQRRLGLDGTPDALTLGIVSRMSWQKGLDLVLENFPFLLESGMQLALLGSGDADLQARFRAAALSHSGQIGCVIGYDEGLAHLIQAGADAILVPSRFEPCGLTQLCAMRYGAIPVVSRVGGLADSVIDANEMAIAANAATGVQFGGPTAGDINLALRRVAGLFGDSRIWRRLQKNAMTTDVSWKNPARHYADLYRQLATA
jgi:starch synthase